MDRNQGRPRREANFSTQQHQAQTNPWISSAHGDQERASGSTTTARQGPGTARPITASNPSQALLRRTAGFPRLKRLTKAKDFGRVFANPTRSSDRYFTALSHPNKGNMARLGLTVSRRIARNAVDRNRLKRLVREVFRCQQDLPLLDFVVLANKAAPAAENRVLRDSLQRHFDILAARMD